MTQDEGRPDGAARASSYVTVPVRPDDLYARSITRQMTEACWRVAATRRRLAVEPQLARLLAHFRLIEPDPDRPGEARLSARGEALGLRKVRQDARRLRLEVPEWARER